ncbi:MAG TPA: hypothetical protein VG325_13190 [Solirubrobacteraceae bacterium]|jgi:hypothetical protein|nr:hypothetical protein [Solirubrobacteraceae bacterium]
MRPKDGNVRYAQPLNPARYRSQWLLSPFMTIGCALAVAACGSSSTTSNSTRHGASLAFSACMRSHGVPNFPDPSAGGGIQIQAGSGLNPFSPSFRAAQAGCRRLLPGGGPGAEHPTAQAKAEMLKISQCMRQHGITGFPDPTLTPRSSPAGSSAIIDRGGVVLAIPDTIDTRAPAFNQAAAACGFGH